MLMVELTREDDVEVYYIPIVVEFGRSRINKMQGPGVRKNKSLKSLSSSIWVGDPYFEEIDHEVDLSSPLDIAPNPNTCVPIYARTSSNGLVDIMFNHPIDLLVNEDDLMIEILESGAIEVQLVTAFEQDKDKAPSFSWTVKKLNEDSIQFKMVWGSARAFSAGRLENDSLRIFLDDLSSVLEC